MEIKKVLNIDQNIDYLESGTIAQASAIVANRRNNALQSEHGIAPVYTYTDPEEKTIGYIACSDEYILFTNKSNIIRCAVDNSFTTNVLTNWNWQGGKVIGTYTYNVNNELIVAITEIGVDADVPLKIINLNKPNYVITENDNKYTLSPDIPKFNLINYTFTTGSNIYKGTYVFFIRFKIDDTSATSWFKLGSPIIVSDSINTKLLDFTYYTASTNSPTVGPGYQRVSIDVSSSAEKTNKNIRLAINIVDDTKRYKQFQVGYIVTTTKFESKVFVNNYKDIGVNATALINNDTDEEVSVDDMTAQSAFNMFNVKTLCNYNNRLYISNYKEENNNIHIKDINLSNVIVRAFERDDTTPSPDSGVVNPDFPVIPPYIDANGKTWQWTEDAAPGDNDFKINSTYSFPIYSTYLGKYSKSFLNVTPQQIGIDNRTESGAYINVTKKYALVVPFKDYWNASDDMRKLTGSETYHVKMSPALPAIYQGKIGDLMIGFTKSKEDGTSYTADFFYYEDVNNPRSGTSIRPAGIGVWIEIYATSWASGTIKVTYTPLDAFIRKSTMSSTDNNEVTTTVVSEIPKYAINNSVYNFFVHYVYPNGNYTDGIQIQNNQSVVNENIYIGSIAGAEKRFKVNEDTKIKDINDYFELLKLQGEVDTTGAHDVIINPKTNSDDLYFCNLYPQYDSRKVALYKNSNGDRLFRGNTKAGTTTAHYMSTCKFVFDNIPMLPDFVGFFISYEKTEPIVTAQCITTGEDSHVGIVEAYIQRDEIKAYYGNFSINKTTACNFFMSLGYGLFQGYSYVGSQMMGAHELTLSGIINHDQSAQIVDISKATIVPPNYNNKNVEGHLKLKLANKVLTGTIRMSENATQLQRTVGLLYTIDNEHYTSTNKELISLGFIKYVAYEDGKTYNYGYEQYPYNYDYYDDEDISFSYNVRGVSFDEIDPYPRDDSGVVYYKYPVNLWTENLYGSVFITAARMNTYNLYPNKFKNVRETPVSRYYTYHKEDNSWTKNILNTVPYPNMVNNMLELNTSYFQYTDKLINNYNSDTYNNHIELYTKVVRRSDVISNESIKNSWRIFRAEQYKVIAENKGDVINLVGIGTYLIVHCEHSMFIFNRDSSMQTENKDVQLVIPDAFDIDYVEVFTSTRGYAGIQKFNQFNCSNYGYVFYDSDSHKLYRYDNSKLIDITNGLKFLFDKEVLDINFAVDDVNERLICVGTVKDGTKTYKFTVSYSFAYEAWISTHPYHYGDCFNTKNNVYFVDNNKELAQIDSFDLTKYNVFTNVIDVDNIFKTELDEADGNPFSYADIVVSNTNIDKVLNFVRYVLARGDDVNFTGNKLVIYSNCCYSGYSDISHARSSYHDYKSPYFDYGAWNFNWFRNRIQKINENNPILRGTGKFNEAVVTTTTRGVDNALMVGKYFVVRLIFKDVTKVINLIDIDGYAE